MTVLGWASSEDPRGAPLAAGVSHPAEGSIMAEVASRSRARCGGRVRDRVACVPARRVNHRHDPADRRRHDEPPPLTVRCPVECGQA